MIKKGTAIFFILLANIILLVIAVVPHHHHKAEVCIVNTHCQSDNNNSEQSASKNEHEHDGKNNTQYCGLNQVVAILSSSVRQDGDCLVFNSNQELLLDCQSIIPRQALKSFASEFTKNTHALLINSSYSHFINTSLGLRGSPTV